MIENQSFKREVEPAKNRIVVAQASAKRFVIHRSKVFGG